MQWDKAKNLFNCHFKIYTVGTLSSTVLKSVRMNMRLQKKLYSCQQAQRTTYYTFNMETKFMFPNANKIYKT